MKKKQRRKGPMRLPLLLLTHALVLGIALLAYALPHHVLAQKGTAIGLVSSRVASSYSQDGATTQVPATPVPTAVPTAQPTAAPERADSPATAVPTAQPTATLEPQPTLVPDDKVGSFRNKFADHFTDGEVIETANSYRSKNLDITITEHFAEEYRARYFVVDAYVADIACLGTVFGDDTFGRGYIEWPLEVAQRTGSIVTMNGDYYGARESGVVIRNGVLYLDTPSSRDVGVIYWDGVMKTFGPRDFDAEAEIANGAYHAWNFGPMLLDENGKAKARFNSDYPYMTPRSPRSAIGYFEPGHYCFVVVDGRSETTLGVDLPQLSQIMEDVGCVQAFNLDGGGTTMLYAKTKLLNDPYKGGRQCSDFLVLMDVEG